MNVAFIGLGIMGSRMAANLQKNNQQVVVYNRTKEKARPLLEEDFSAVYQFLSEKKDGRR